MRMPTANRRHYSCQRISTILLLSWIHSRPSTHAWSPVLTNRFRTSSRFVSVSAEPVSFEAASGDSNNNNNQAITTTDSKEVYHLVSKLRFRELQNELQKRNLSIEGPTAVLKARLRQAMISSTSPEDECVVNEKGEENCITSDMLNSLDVTFTDVSDPDFEKKTLIKGIKFECDKGYWRTATRKLKKLTSLFGPAEVDESVYLQVLDVCMMDRMQAARASERARKILDLMVESGYTIPDSIGNYCVQNSFDLSGADFTHQGFGGLDTALAMLYTLRESKTTIYLETYEKLITALAKDGSLGQALDMLRNVVVDVPETPPLSLFADIANACVNYSTSKTEEGIMTLLAYVKAAGYDLETIASTDEGRTILACGIIAAERLGNEALGLRLLTAASKAEGCAPDKGDILIALQSSTAQRACTLIHKRAIIKAVEDSQWKLAVRLLELMIERGLKPSNWIWRNVVTCCAKAEKSKKSTALLLDWVRLAEGGKTDKPPLSVFNTVINTCEICGEQDLTLLVLDAMKKTHDTEGNLITFNIALKRLAKSGNYAGCEGIIIGMLQSKVEPSVVSYTTAIAACASAETKQPELAYEWIRRMRARNVAPNAVTYNTALAACLDDKLQSTILASKIATEMMSDVEKQLVEDADQVDEYVDVVPNSATKMLARATMRQLKQNWKNMEIDKSVATATIRIPLLRLIDFEKSEAATEARKKYAERKSLEEDQAPATSQAEELLDFSTAQSVHRTAEV